MAAVFRRLVPDLLQGPCLYWPAGQCEDGTGTRHALVSLAQTWLDGNQHVQRAFWRVDHRGQQPDRIRRETKGVLPEPAGASRHGFPADYRRDQSPDGGSGGGTYTD